jgi:hypothetical protein
MLGQGCRVDGVTLPNQILFWLPEYSNLCVVLAGNIYKFLHKRRELQRCTI